MADTASRASARREAPLDAKTTAPSSPGRRRASPSPSPPPRSRAKRPPAWGDGDASALRYDEKSRRSESPPAERQTKYRRTRSPISSRGGAERNGRRLPPAQKGTDRYVPPPREDSSRGRRVSRSPSPQARRRSVSVSSYSSYSSRSRSPSVDSRGRSLSRSYSGSASSRSRSYSTGSYSSRSRSYSADSRSPRSRSRSVSRTPSRSPARSVSRTPSPALKEKSTSKRRARSPSPARASSRKSVSPSPPPRRPRALPDVDRRRAAERERQAQERLAAEGEKEKKEFDPRAEYKKLLELRSGGTYVPPARLRALQAQFTETDEKEKQRQAWEELKRGINGQINKVNKANIREIVQDVFKQNLIRGKGLFVRSIMRAQAASLPYTPVYAALAAIVNTKLPQIGELLVTRLIIQFRKGFKRNDKTVCLSSTMFLAHLCNYQVAHEIIILQIMHLLLERPTDDSVEIAVGFMREVGAYLETVSPAANNGVYERLRAILHEGELDKRTQYMIEVLFLVRKNKYEDNPSILPDLDLVEEEDQITHMLGLEDQLNGEDGLNVFKFDENFAENEEKYQAIKHEILGDSDDEDEDDDSDVSSEDEETEPATAVDDGKIKDMTNKDLVNLRRTIYLTIRSSMDFEECCHKLLRIKLPPGQEIELVNMIIECCSQEKIYSKFYGLVAERFCKLGRFWNEPFTRAFETYYDTIHRYETNKIRNIAKLFAHVFASDGIRWKAFACIHLNEDETTASSRIFIKILFQDLVEEIGMKELLARLEDLRQQDPAALSGLFPRNNPADTRFAINFFTAIGLGPLTEDLRVYLKKATERAAALAEEERRKFEEEKEREEKDKEREKDSGRGSSRRRRGSSVSSYSSYSSYSD
ncbi:hypothetical protein BZA70DRAFT_270236 [Myxozyma melibiosi]|uniref:Pre-mRNA-splicing factor CWC22 n=1 Tax=Myxozyma melibiosi TaxID=54550 RepID=A0ABR1FB11_9ASCO